MQINNTEMRVLIKERAITEYFYRGQTFLEGRPGSNYEIEFKNNNNFQIEVILSVDGLSITDGKEAGPNSSGYIVDANSVIRVPGWTLNTSEVAAFAFSDLKGGSYAEQITGSSVNKGVIGALVYRPVHTPQPRRWVKSINIAASGYSDMPYGTSGLQPSYDTFMRSSAMPLAASASVYASATMPLMNGMPQNSISGSGFEAVEQSLGTAFGETTSFNTSQVNFERGDLLAMIEMYYDSITGLRARGVPVDRRVNSKPQAFPGIMNVGCTPPPGWRG